MRLTKIAITMIAALVLCLMLPQFPVSAKVPKYIVKIGDESNSYTTYKDIAVLSPEDNVMVKAYTLCKKMGLSYNYDKASKMVTIENKEFNKRLVFTLGDKEYLYYTDKNSEGVTKTADFQCYYDSTGKSIVADAAAFGNIVYYEYKEISSLELNYKIGYRGMVFYNKYLKTKEDVEASVLEPTAKTIQRLKDYDYIYGEPLMDFDELNEDFSEDIHTYMFETFQDGLLLKKNEKIYTCDKLTYITPVYTYVIRYVIQVTQKDGTVVEQDREYEFFDSEEYGVPTVLTVRHKYLSEERVVK